MYPSLCVPSLGAYDTVVLGGTVSGLACALQQADTGRRVLLVEQGTCLYREMDLTGSYAVSVQQPDAWSQRLFPAACMAAPGLCHPDRLKQHGEALCRTAGIALLYAAQALSFIEGHLVIAHKSGLFQIECPTLYDMRQLPGDGQEASRCFALHVLGVDVPLPHCFSLPETRNENGFSIPKDARLTLQAGPGEPGHGVLSVPVLGQGDETSSQGRFALYELALYAFAQLKAQPGFASITLARSGFVLGAETGWDADSCIAFGLQAQAGWMGAVAPAAPEAFEDFAFINPCFPQRWPVPFAAPLLPPFQGDVVVVGGGTAGALAAYSAARQGLRVLLLEMNEVLGGTATCGGVSIYWFGTRDGATALVDRRVDALYRRLGLPRSACLWNENDVFLPDLKAHALLSMCLEAGVEIRFGAVTCAVLQKDAHQVTGVAYAQGGRLHTAHASMVIDATGDADVAMFAGARHTYGGQDNALTYWGSLAQYTSPGSYKNNFSTMVHVGDPLDYTRFILAGRLRGGALYDHGRYVALRESRHIQGLSTVTLSDLVACREEESILYQCFSNYDPKGKLTADLVYAGFLPPNLRMNVPLGAVIPTAGDGDPIHGLLVGGKAISCTHDALPGLRMQPDLQQQGFALGVLAAQALSQQVPAWQARHVSQALREAGGQAILPLQDPSPMSLADAVEALRGEETLEWLEMDPAEWTAERSPALRCFLARPSEAVPLLRAALYKKTHPPRRLLLARLLLWHGCDAGAPPVLAAIRQSLGESQGLPPRKGPVTFGQLLPDHGLMPETVYLLNTLAWGKDVPVLEVFAEVLTRIEQGPRDYQDLRAGVYCYIESFAYVAKRRGDPGFAPMLRALLRLPEIAGQSDADPLLAERFAILHLTLFEAMAGLGDPEGHAGLRRLCKHPVLAIASSASMAMDRLAQPSQAGHTAGRMA